MLFQNVKNQRLKSEIKYVHTRYSVATVAWSYVLFVSWASVANLLFGNVHFSVCWFHLPGYRIFLLQALIKKHIVLVCETTCANNIMCPPLLWSLLKFSLKFVRVGSKHGVLLIFSYFHSSAAPLLRLHFLDFIFCDFVWSRMKKIYFCKQWQFWCHRLEVKSKG